MTAVDQAKKNPEKDIKTPKSLLAFDFSVYSSNFII